MEIKIRGEKLKITDAMRDYVEEKIGKLDKYLENSENVYANVIVKVKGHQETVEITIPLKSFILRSEETNEDFYAAVDKTIDKLERQIRKNKTKARKNLKQVVVFNDFEVSNEEDIDEVIVKRKTIDAKPMSEEEAILQMELIGHDFFLFKNDKTDSLCVVYKRKDNGYGILEAN